MSNHLGGVADVYDAMGDRTAVKPAMTEAMREQFEAWWDSTGYVFSANREMAWKGYQAALRSPAVAGLVEADREYDAALKGWAGERYEVDSYGVHGSDFDRCLCCDAESGAGILNKGVTHEPDCKVAAIERAERRRTAALAQYATLAGESHD